MGWYACMRCLIVDISFRCAERFDRGVRSSTCRDLSDDYRADAGSLGRKLCLLCFEKLFMQCLHLIEQWMTLSIESL